MRIVGGEFRGRRLAQPKNQAIRPTSDRNRESLFNVISHNWPEKLESSRVLDIFAGTGALGFEALSRGAEYCMFVELKKQGWSLIQQNIDALNVENRASILRKDATKPGKVPANGRFSLLFADPPYGKGLGERAIAAFAENGFLSNDVLVVLEERFDCLPDHLPGFNKCDERRTGETALGFFEMVTQE